MKKHITFAMCLIFNRDLYIPVVVVPPFLVGTQCSRVLTIFGEGQEVFRQIITGCTGGAVVVFTITIAIIMLVNGYKQIKDMKKEHL